MVQEGTHTVLFCSDEEGGGVNPNGLFGEGGGLLDRRQGRRKGLNRVTDCGRYLRHPNACMWSPVIII